MENINYGHVWKGVLIDSIFGCHNRIGRIKKLNCDKARVATHVNNYKIRPRRASERNKGTEWAFNELIAPRIKAVATRKRQEAEAEKKRQAELARKQAKEEKKRQAELARKQAKEEKRKAEQKKIQEQLKAELAKLKEAQRDHLAEAYNKRSTPEREAIQLRLYERGLYQSTIDGLLGAGTRAAIEDYVLANNKPGLKTNQNAEAVVAEIAALAPLTVSVKTADEQGPKPADLTRKAEAQQYLDDIKSFVSLNPGVLDGIVLAGSYGPALEEIKATAFNRSGSNFLKLVAYTKGLAPFREYREVQVTKRYESRQAKRQEIAAAISAHIETVRARLIADPMAADAFQLTQVFKKYQTIPADVELAALQNIRSGLEQEMKKLGLSVAGEPAPAAKQASAPAVTSTVELKQLSDIGPSDIAMIVNLGSDAPHSFRDLAGKIKFEDKKIRACAPSLGTLDPQYRAFVAMTINRTLGGNTFEFTENCHNGLGGHDVLIVSGTDLAKSQDIPPPAALVGRFKKGGLARLLVIKNSDFSRELARRDILSSQYESDIREGARVGFGAVAFKSQSKVGCTVIEEDLDGHDQSILAVSGALQFLNGNQTTDHPNVAVTVAFRQAQKGHCAFIYSSAKTLKVILDASQKATLVPQVLPVWFSTSTIANRLKDLATAQSKKVQSKGDRLAELKKKQTEERAKQAAKASQLEQRQKRYREQHGAKVTSLVAMIDSELKEVREKIDGALADKQNVSATVSQLSFWGPIPRWYADKRMKGWDFESTVSVPEDYGIASWSGREVEAITAQTRILLKNRTLGEYSDTCWNVGYLIDSEFSMRREPFTAPCEDANALPNWQARSSFETRWDLGVQQ